MSKKLDYAQLLGACNESLEHSDLIATLVAPEVSTIVGAYKAVSEALTDGERAQLLDYEGDMQAKASLESTIANADADLAEMIAKITARYTAKKASSTIALVTLNAKLESIKVPKNLDDYLEASAARAKLANMICSSTAYEQAKKELTKKTAAMLVRRYLQTEIPGEAACKTSASTKTGQYGFVADIASVDVAFKGRTLKAGYNTESKKFMLGGITGKASPIAKSQSLDYVHPVILAISLASGVDVEIHNGGTAKTITRDELIVEAIRYAARSKSSYDANVGAQKLLNRREVLSAEEVENIGDFIPAAQAKLDSENTAS